MQTFFYLFSLIIPLSVLILVYYVFHEIKDDVPKKLRNILLAVMWVVTLAQTFVVMLMLGCNHISSEKTEEITTDTLKSDSIVTEIVVKEVIKPVVKKDVVKETPKPETKPISNDTFTCYVTLTTYNAVASQCDGNPLITANGTKIDLDKLKRKEIKYCAVSRDLLKIIPYNSIIEIEGHGFYRVCDTMNKRYTKYVDILQDIAEKNFKKTNVKITRIS